MGLRSLGHLDFVVYLLVRAYQLWRGAGEFNLFKFRAWDSKFDYNVNRLTVCAYDFVVANMGPRFFWFWF